MSVTESPDRIIANATESLGARVAQFARSTPDAVAIRYGRTRLTYAGLTARAHALAARLATLQVQPEQPVGILMHRSPDLICAVLGVLDAGAAYLALDPADPPERRASILRSAGVTVIIADEPHPVTDEFVILLAPDCFEHSELDQSMTQLDLPQPVDDSRRLAYIAYTSGSTGQPKGVCVTHRAVLDLVVDADFMTVGTEDVFLHYAPAAFDASTLEIWGALLNGACLVIAPPGTLSPAELAELVRDEQITVLWLTAGLFHQFVDARPGRLPDVRYLLAGGDVLSADHVERCRSLLPDGVVVNGYGPTENTTFTCCHTVRQRVNPAIGVPIGVPVAGGEVRVLDEALRPVPEGQAGTLYAVGSGLARGYHGRPDLTAVKFLPDPYGDPGTRMYDTGDQVRRLPDGSLQFLGRLDDQVKIRGFRVEPAEIEAELRRHPRVRQAAVVVTGSGQAGRRLAGFYVSDSELDAAELREQLVRSLPSYLVPAELRRLDELPITANGKVDRRALAGLASQRTRDVDSDYREPGTDTERWLAELWREVMELDAVGVDDDFFELGGHSLLATRITGEITARYDVFISARTFYENPTVAELAIRIHDVLPAPDRNDEAAQ